LARRKSRGPRATHERIRYTDKFDDSNLPGEIIVTVVLRKVSCGTELHIEQAGVPAVIPAEACYPGWQDSLNQLAALVEPEIPNYTIRKRAVEEVPPSGK